MNEKKLISRFSSKLFLERAKILNAYALKTVDQGEMYYVYSRSVVNIDCYNICRCIDGHFRTFAVTSILDLPKGSHVGSVLRKKTDGFSLDEVATEEVEKSFKQLMKEILEEQEEYYKRRRLENHIYIVSEKYSESLCLYDITYQDEYSEEMEEILFPEEVIRTAHEGFVFMYKDGKYKRIYDF